MKSPRLAVMLAVIGGLLMVATGVLKPDPEVVDGMRWGSLLLIGAALFLGAPGTSGKAPAAVRLGVGLIAGIAVVTVIEVMRPDQGFGFDLMIGALTLLVSLAVLVSRLAKSREQGDLKPRRSGGVRRAAGAPGSRRAG